MRLNGIIAERLKQQLEEPVRRLKPASGSQSTDYCEQKRAEIPNNSAILYLKKRH